MSKPINPNDRVRVKLTEHGKRLIVAHIDRLNDSVRKRRPDGTLRFKVPEWDTDGWLNEQFHSLMGMLGDCWSLGCELPFTELKSLEVP